MELFRLICLFFACSYIGVQGQEKSCNDIIPVLPDLERRERNNSANSVTGDNPLINDYFLNTDWYNVTTGEGQYLMSDSTNIPEVGKCGTLYPVYINGTHPNITELTPNGTTVVACLRNMFSICDVSYKISVRNCSGNIQYHLRITRRSSAYCFDPPAVPKDTTPEAPTTANIGTVQVEPTLMFELKRTNDTKNSTNYHPFLMFNCSFNKEDLFYTVNWYINGGYFTQTGPSQSMADHTISEQTLLQRNVTLGFTIQCGVRASTSIYGLTTEAIYSKNFFAGIKVLTPNVVLNKSSEAKIKFQPTIPIGCRYNDITSTLAGFECLMGLNVVDPSEYYECRKGNLITRSEHRRCGRDFKALKLGEKFNASLEVEITVQTSDFNYNDSRTFTLHLRTDDDFGHELWKEYSLDMVKVTVIDDESYKHKVCYSHVDPHMKTADGEYYELHKKGGEYLLYRNKDYGVEVQMKTEPCAKGLNLTCACGVAIRAGGDVFMINVCGSVNFIDFLSCEDGGILHIVEIKSNLYHIYTPIGTWIEVDFQSVVWMNIDVTMSPKDMMKTEGLCGHLNANKSDDFVTKEGVKEMIFSDSWRLVDDESFFFKVRPTELPRWEETNGFFCVCEQALSGSQSKPVRTPEVACRSTQYMDCTFKNDLTEKKCNLVRSKKKKSLEQFQINTDTLLNLMRKPREQKLADRQKRQESNYILTEADAWGNCTTFIMDSLAVRSYKSSLIGENPENVIQQCTMDLLAGNNLLWGQYHVEALNNKVRREFQLNPIEVANNTQYVETFLKNTCQNNCSNRGVCSNEGECACSTGYYGPDCGIDAREPIGVDHIEGGNLCDLSDSGSCRCFYVYTTQLISNFSCEFITKEVGVHYNIISSTSVQVVGELYDIFSGFCCLPERPISATFVTQYDIALSNSGTDFGDAFTVTVYDSTCQSVVENEDGTSTAILQSDQCFIDGKCVEDGGFDLNDQCSRCNTSLNVFNWTNVCEPLIKHLSEDHPNVIVPVVLSGVVLLVVLLGVAGFVWRQKLRKVAKWFPHAHNNRANLQSDVRTVFDFQYVYGYRRSTSSGELYEASGIY